MDDIVKPTSPSNSANQGPHRNNPNFDLDRPKHKDLAKKISRSRWLKRISLGLLISVVLFWIPFRFYFTRLERVTSFYQNNYDNSSIILETLTDTHAAFYEDGLTSEEIGSVLNALDTAKTALNSYEPSQPRLFVVSFATKNISGGEQAVEKLKDEDMSATWNLLEQTLREYVELLTIVSNTISFNITEAAPTALKKEMESAIRRISGYETLDKDSLSRMTGFFISITAEIEQFESTNNQIQFAAQLVNINGEAVKTLDAAWQSIVETSLSDFSEMVSDNEYILNVIDK